MKSIDDYRRELMDYSSRSTVGGRELFAEDSTKEEENLPVAQNSGSVDNTSLGDSGFGTLIVSLTHSKGLFPIAGASVCIEDSAGKRIGCKQTDQSGKTTEWQLPAPSKELSENPGVAPADVSSFYTIRVTADGYLPVVIEGIPIFDGVKTLQPLDMFFAGAAPSGLPEVIKFSNSYTL